MKRLPLSRPLLAAALCGGVFAAAHAGWAPLADAELKLHDALFCFRAAKTSTVVLAAVDERYLEHHAGLPRAELAAAIGALRKAGAKAIGLDLPLLPAPSGFGGAGAAAAAALELQAARARVAAMPIASRDPDRPWKTLPPGTVSPILSALDEAKSKLGTVKDAPGGGDPLADIVRGSDVVLAVSPAAPVGPALALAAAGVGRAGVSPDADGKVRSVPLQWGQGAAARRSFPLEVARVASRLAPKDVRLSDDWLRLGAATVPLEGGRVRPAWREAGGFTAISFSDLAAGKASPAAVKGRVVLIGLAAEGLGAQAPTPADPSASQLELDANAADALLGGGAIDRPEWAPAAESGALVLVFLAGAWLLPALSPLLSFAAAAILGALLLGAEGAALARGFWIQLAGPTAALGACALAALVREEAGTRAEFASRIRRMSPPSIDSNLLLGASFTRAAMLDLAFEHLRKAPLDKECAKLLYKLGRACEEKGEWGEAAAVYGYIATKFESMDDVAVRLGEALRKMPPPPPQKSEAPAAGTSGFEASLEELKKDRLEKLEKDLPIIKDE